MRSNKDMFGREIKIGDIVLIRGAKFAVVTSFTPKQVKYLKIDINRFYISVNHGHVYSDEMLIINNEMQEFKKSLILRNSQMQELKKV